MITGFFFCAVFGIFGSNSLTPLGLYSLAAIQLLFLAFGCLFNSLKEHREIAADYPGKNFAKPRRDFAISSILGSSGVIALAAAVIFVCISFVKPETYITVDGKTYYIRPASMSRDCRYTQAENLFFLESWQPSTAGYSAQSCSDVYSMLNPTQSPTYPDSLSTTEPSVRDTDSTSAEKSTTPPLHTPATSAVSEDSLVHTPVEVPGAGAGQYLSVVLDGNFYQSVQQVDGQWVRGGDITAIGMHREVYDVIPLDDHVWVIGFGTPEGGENFITTDAGATWTAFLPEGFAPGGSEPSFLEKAKADKEGYSITTNYPSWVKNADEGVTFVSTDGVEWAKK